MYHLVCGFESDSELSEGIKVASIAYDGSEGSPRVKSYNLRGLEEVRSSLSTFQDADCCRIISICQRNSWQPLQITPAIVEVIVSKLSLSSSLKELSSCFYDRDDDTEQTLCLPWTMRCIHGSEEVAYTIRYPEFKKDDNKWVIRQTGIIQSYNRKKLLNTYILLEPKPSSLLAALIAEEIEINATSFRENPLWLHCLLFSTYFPAWRDYLLFRENQLIPLANKTFATFIHQPLRIGYEALSTLVGLKDKFSQSLVILGHMSSTMEDLRLHVHHHLGHPKYRSIKEEMMQAMKRYERLCTAHSRSATYLHQRTQDLISLLSDTLSLRDQVVSNEQNNNMLELNKSAVFITTVTLLYLPSSWLATFFGMNFFDLDMKSHRLVASSIIWIFIVASVTLTGATIGSYWFMLRRKRWNKGKIKGKARLSGDRALAGLSKRLTWFRSQEHALDELPK